MKDAKEIRKMMTDEQKKISDDLYKRATKNHPKVTEAMAQVFEDFSKMSTEELKELIKKTPPEYRGIIEALDRGEF